MAQVAKRSFELINQANQLSEERQKSIDALEEKLTLQQQLKEQEELATNQALMAELGHVAGGIAHEINNPLSIITLSNLQILKQAQENGDQKTIQHSEKISATLKRISKVVQSMLKLFRGKAGSDGSEKCDLSGVLEDILVLSEAKIKTNGIDLQLKMPVEKVVVSGAETEISQVILNLVNNSISEILEMENPWIKVEGEFFGDSRIRLMVSDSGPGKPADLRSKIFAPFFMTKPVGQGTGLGLSLSKSLVERFNGRLYLKDTESTCFVVELDVHTESMTVLEKSVS
ncbi:MAG: hypothetical protein HRT45_13830 [Bdellovibrionales bacterium]|nr:hypothetical protein [Bdellovibrionales bacterium]